MSHLRNCYVCKKLAIERLVANPKPWQDSIQITCDLGCQGVFTGTNHDNIREEWNETQRVMSGERDAWEGEPPVQDEPPVQATSKFSWLLVAAGVVFVLLALAMSLDV